MKYRVNVRREISTCEDFEVEADNIDEAEATALKRAEVYDWPGDDGAEFECVETTAIDDDGTETVARITI